MSKTYTPAETVEKDFVDLVRLELDDIKNTFFKIGFRLKEAQQFMYYKKLGFNTIEECAEELFGFKKSTTYDLINIAREFYDPQAPMRIKEEYSNYTQSQLVLFTQVNMAPRGFFQMASPSDTIKDLRTAKKYWRMYQLGNIPGMILGNGTKIKEFIQIAEKKLGAKKALPEPKEENSRRLENSETVPDLIEVNAVEQVSSETPPQNSPESIKEAEQGENRTGKINIEQLFVEAFIKEHKAMKWRTISELDNHKFGMNIQPIDIAWLAIKACKTAALKNHTEFKHVIEDIIIDFLDKYNYEIILHGRKQGHRALAGNIANNLLDELTGVKGEKE